MTPDSRESSSFVLNTAIGFLSLLLVLLIFGLFTRIVYPRIENQRNEISTNLIGEIIQLEVLNGCGVPGVANTFTSTLRKNGFDVVETGNFKNFDMNNTVIVARTINKDNALKIADVLGVDPQNVIVEASKDYYLDATIIIGSDYKSLTLN